MTVSILNLFALLREICKEKKLPSRPLPNLRCGLIYDKFTILKHRSQMIFGVIALAVDREMLIGPYWCSKSAM